MSWYEDQTIQFNTDNYSGVKFKMLARWELKFSKCWLKWDLLSDIGRYLRPMHMRPWLWTD